MSEHYISSGLSRKIILAGALIATAVVAEAGASEMVADNSQPAIEQRYQTPPS